MNIRRHLSATRDLDTFLVLLLLSVVFHLQPPSLEGIWLDVVGLSYLLVIYTGYRYGRFWGLLAGAVSAGFWLLFTLFTVNDLTASEILFGLSTKGERFIDHAWLESFRVMHFSAQSLLLYAATGYLAGYLCDRVEAWLGRSGATLGDVLPVHDSNYVLRMGDWFERTAKALFLLQLDPEDREGAIKRRLRKIFVLIVTLPLLALFVTLAMQWSIRLEGGGAIYLVPALFSPVLALWLAHRAGPLIGVWLSLSLLFSPLAAWYFRELDLPGEIHFSNYASPLSIVVTLAVAAWLIGTVSRQLKNERLRQQLLVLADRPAGMQRLSIAHIVLLLGLCIELIYRDEGLYLKYFSTLLLAAYVLWLSLRYNTFNVSNTVLLVIGATALFRLDFRLEDSAWRIQLGGTTIPELIFLALIPHASRYFRVDSLNAVRHLYLTLLVGLTLMLMLFSYGDSDIVPSVLVRLRYENLTFPLLSLALILLVVEGMARASWWVLKRRAAPNTAA